MEIPSKIQERLNQFSEMYGIPVETLKNEMLAYLPKVREEHPRMSPEKRLVLCLRLLKLQLQREEGGVNSKAIMHTGFFFGCSPIQNTADRMIAKIKRMPPELQKKFHPKPEVWLDYREGSDNYMKPIKGYDHRTFYFIGSSGRELAEDRVKLGMLEVWDDLITEVVPTELHILYNFRAIPRDTDRQLPYYDLKASSVTRFRPCIDQIDDLEKERLVRKVCDVYSINDVETIYEMKFVPPEDPEERREFRREPIFVEGDVLSIFITDEDKQNVIRLTDFNDLSNYELRCFVPKYISINFAENQRILAFGTLSKSRRQGSDEEAIVMNMMGYVIVPLESEYVNL
ncbi:MAG: hypothetical protein ACTSPB_24935 [Candidatus Thorarchaeota archaeon]